MRPILQLLLLLSLLCSQGTRADAPYPYSIRLDGEQQEWLRAKGTLVVGMPTTNWEPYSYYLGNNQYQGLLHDYINTLTKRLGLRLRYQSYPTLYAAQQALQRGEVDVLGGLAVTPQRLTWMTFTPQLIEIPRAVLLGKTGLPGIPGIPGNTLSLAQATEMQWVCERGYDTCDILSHLGFKKVKMVDANTEALFMVKYGLAEAYLSDRPYLESMIVNPEVRSQQIVTLPWFGPAELSLATRADQRHLGELLALAVNSLTPEDRNILTQLAHTYDDTSDINGISNKIQSLFTAEESAWIAAHPEVTFAPSPWVGLGHVDENGQFSGFVADLLALVEHRSGLHFKLRPTNGLNSLVMVEESELDLAPSAINLPERRTRLRFTSDYLVMKRLLVTRRERGDLASLKDIKGARVAGSFASADDLLIRSWQATPVPFTSFSEQLLALAEGRVDYILIFEGFTERLYSKESTVGLHVAYSGAELDVPMAMAVPRDKPILASILTKALQSIQPEELQLLQDKWFTIRIEAGVSSGQIVRLILPIIGGIVFVAVMGYLWNRSLSREVRQRQQAETMLSQQLQLVELLLDTMPNPVVLTDNQKAITLTNKAYRKLYFSAHESHDHYGALFKDSLLRGFLPNEILQRVQWEDSQVWELGVDISSHAAVTLPDGSKLELMYHKRLFCGQDGSRLGVLTVLTDVTELRQAQARAEEAAKARERFLATMSHELRTPIAGMHGMLELLQLGGLSDDQRYLVSNVVSSADNLLYLVNDILDYSKLEAGQLQLEMRPVCLAEVLCAVVRSHVESARQKGLRVQLVWDPNLPDQADLDPTRLGQIFSNLLHNAIKFTEQGTVTLTLASQESQLLLTVADTGIGITPEQLLLLFTPFEQGDGSISRRFGGSGLGLSISRNLAEQMGGSLTLESEPGLGTRAILLLPLVSPYTDSHPLAGSHWQVSASLGEARTLLQRFGADVVEYDMGGAFEPWLLLLDETDLRRLCPEECQEGEGPLELDESMPNGCRVIVLSEQESLRTSLRQGSCLRLGYQPLYPDLLLESCLALISPPDAYSLEGQPAVRSLRGRVLVAEDHPINRALLQRQLTLLGVAFEICENGRSALQSWQTGSFDLLLTDCHMPEMDGYKLTEVLRSQGVMSPIIGVTADASEGANSQGHGVGMTDMLHKPYKLTDLGRVLGRYLAIASDMALVPPVGRTMSERWVALFGSEAAARSMAVAYLGSNEADLVRLSEAYAVLNWDAMTNAAHSIRGAAEMVDETRLAELAAAIEMLSKRRQPSDELADLIWQLQNKVKDTGTEIGTWLDERVVYSDRS